ncbi:prolyl oligopeptidase family serine peptidase [Paenibacillus sp. GP183]|uniref:S9 family peptidase n=1 Tax=Paenibacillus sp. GP183 TaxID=1882751 RepID=UPI00089A8447|nr:prolyl oligopeptidase family serine peptidase [Paenibacillus sp. GP183]SEB49428.1 Dipeptidyl aminopeptidase/acylaminoacyl peptidase [Paenibacillus sp. GP183]
MSQPLTLDDVLNTVQPAHNFPYLVSPNGQWLAFTVDGLKSKEVSVGVSTCVEGCSQWVCDLENKKAFPIFPDASSSWSGVWSPDGSKLSFFADKDGEARLWLWDPSNNSLTQASKIGARPFFGFEAPIWTLDGKSIIFKAMPSNDVDNSTFRMESKFINQDLLGGNNIQVYSTENTSDTEELQKTDTWIERYRADLIRLDLETGETTLISGGHYPVGMILSNDGKKIAFTSALGQENINSIQVLYDLWIASVFPQEGEVSTCLVKSIRMEYGLSFAWAYDDNSIIFTTGGPLSDGNLWTVDISDSPNPRPLSHGKELHLGREFDAPVPLEQGDTLMISNGRLWRYKNNEGEITDVAPQLNKRIIAMLPYKHESGYVVVQTKDPDKMLYGFWKVNFLVGEIEKILEEPRHHYPAFVGGATIVDNNNNKFIVYIAQSANEPPALWVINLETKVNFQIVELSSFPKESLGVAQLLQWKLKGRELHGALLLPPNKKGRVPVIIRVYHGKLSDRLHTFGLWNHTVDNHQLFASRGYAVLLPDLVIEGNEPADEIAMGLEEAVNALKQHPDIDANRIGIIGHSYGGYAALVGISKLQHFRAAVVSAGIGNLISASTLFDPNAPDSFFGMVEGGQGFMLNNHIWENRERYIRNSPLFEFDQVQTPILIVQGTKDHICFIESGMIYSSLRRLGKKAELIYYKGEHHWQGTWQRDNIQDYYNRVFKWFNQHLKKGE